MGLKGFLVIPVFLISMFFGAFLLKFCDDPKTGNTQQELIEIIEDLNLRIDELQGEKK